MIRKSLYDLGVEPSKIRELFAYGLARKEKIGEDKVFDFSIGNPSVPAPKEVKDTIINLLETDPVVLHTYSPASGFPTTKEAIAQSIRDNYDFPATADQVYMTAGAAGGLAISIGAITNPGDEVIVISPYFPEYKTWIDHAECSIVEVPAAVPSFTLDIDALDKAINAKTSAVIINSPNNPVGSVYTRKNLEDFAELLRRKERELNREIYLISDEPYRLISYGAEVPWVPSLYDRTIVCYSYSKALSLPGERIGWVYVSDAMENAQDVMFAVAGAGRAYGYVCAPVLLQRVIEQCVNLPSDVEAYRRNRDLLTSNLSDIGYQFVEPEGAFYLWVKALEDDAEAFSDRAKDYELLLVPSNSFGTTGWVRISYCVSEKTIKDAIPAFRALYESYVMS